MRGFPVANNKESPQCGLSNLSTQFTMDIVKEAQQLREFLNQKHQEMQERVLEMEKRALYYQQNELALQKRISELEKQIQELQSQQSLSAHLHTQRPIQIHTQQEQPLPNLKAFQWTGNKQPQKPPTSINPKLQELVTLLHGDTAGAQRLLEQQQKLKPGQPADWYLQKVLDDIKRDRRCR